MRKFGGKREKPYLCNRNPAERQGNAESLIVGDHGTRAGRLGNGLQNR